MKKNTIIISGFPGVGKSHFVKNSSLNVLDSDSSKFDKSKFPENYIDHIETNIGKADIILVSSHENVRKAMRSAGLNFYTVSPVRYCKAEYLDRYTKRGSSEAFIKLVAENWEVWIESFMVADNKNAFQLTSGKYLSDIVPDIISYHTYYDKTPFVNKYRPQGNLLTSEWKELVALEYVLTWNYSDDPARDEGRHAELRDKKDAVNVEDS